MRPQHLRRAAFTMIELIIVIVVLGLLAAAGIVAYTTVVTTSQDRAASLALTDVAREASALAAQNGESEWSEDDWTTALADTAAGPALSGSGVSAAGKLALVNTAADSTNSSSMSYGQVSLQSRTGGIAGLAMRSQAGHCVFVKAVLPQQITAWTAASDLGGNCLASTGLDAGPAGTYTYVKDPVSGATPLAPTGLTAALSGATVNLAWSTVPGASSYTLYRSTDGGATWTKLTGPQSGTTATDATVTAGGTFSYAVTATATNESPKSAPATVTLVPAAPSGVTATGSGTQITVAWTAPAGATSFAVYRDGAAAPAWTGAATTWADTALSANGATHSYTVAASDAAGPGALSAAVSAVVVPAAPASATVSLSGTTATVSWSASTGAASYTVTRTATNLSTGAVTSVTLASTATTSITDTVSSTSAYSYSVAGVDAAGTGPAASTSAAQSQQEPNTAGVAGANLLTNGGFESANWYQHLVSGTVNQARYTTANGFTPAEGSYLGATNSNYTVATATAGNSLQNDVAVTTVTGGSYCFSALVSGQGGSTTSGTLTLWELNGTGQAAAGLTQVSMTLKNVPANPTWVRASGCLTAVSGGAGLRAEIYSPTDGSTLFVDDVRVWKAG